MEGMEEKLGAILGNPAMMQQIMAMAQSFGQSQPEPPPQKPETPPLPDLDPAMLTRIMSLMGNSSIDANQKTLLRALTPYLTAQRIEKLERAMRAAKLAGLATTLLGTQSGTGR